MCISQATHAQGIFSHFGIEFESSLLYAFSSVNPKFKHLAQTFSLFFISFIHTCMHAFSNACWQPARDGYFSAHSPLQQTHFRPKPPCLHQQETSPSCSSNNNSSSSSSILCSLSHSQSLSNTNNGFLHVNVRQDSDRTDFVHRRSLCHQPDHLCSLPELQVPR